MKTLITLIAVLFVGCGEKADPADKLVPVKIRGADAFVRIGDKDWMNIQGKWVYQTGNTYYTTRHKFTPIGMPSETERIPHIEYGIAASPEAEKLIEAYINQGKK